MATQHSYGKIVTSGLVMYLNAADRNSYPGSGTAWNDISGNTNNGVLTNGPTFNSANGGSIVFDGIDDFVNCASTNFNSISAFAFIRPNQRTGTNYPTIIAKWQNPPDQRSWILGIDTPTGKLNSAICSNGVYSISTIKHYYSVSSISYGQWQQVGMTFDNGTFNLYINGQSISVTKPYDASITTIYNSNVTTKIGDSIDGALDFKYSGNIANAMIYNRALSASEILQNYNATKTRFGLT